MSGKRQLVAVLSGVAACVLMVILGEIAIRLAGHQVLSWLAAGVPLTGWRQNFAATTDFFARYFAVMSPLLLLACVGRPARSGASAVKKCNGLTRGCSALASLCCARR